MEQEFLQALNEVLDDIELKVITQHGLQEGTALALIALTRQQAEKAATLAKRLRELYEDP